MGVNLYLSSKDGRECSLPFEFHGSAKHYVLLDFHLGLFQWRWDVPEIEKRTKPAENVVIILRQRMKKK